MALRLESVDQVRFVTMAYAETRNGLNAASCSEIIEAFRDVSSDSSARFLVLRGLPGWFCIGGAGEYIEEAIAADLSARPAYTSAVQAVVLALLQCEVLTVALVDGLAAGAGVDMMCACDLALAAGAARVSLLYGKLGLVPDTGFRLLERRLSGRDPLLTYAECQVLKPDAIVRSGLAEAAPAEAEDDARFARHLAQRFRHDRDAFAAAKRLRNAALLDGFERELELAAHSQALALERPSTRHQIGRSAGLQRTF